MAKNFLGITIEDVGNFATGMIERDREKTAKRLEDTKERLIAERNNYLAMKKSKYDSEIKEFESENKKSKAIQSVNSQFAGQEITPSQWGQAYLREVDSTTYNNLIKTYEGDTEGLSKAFASYYTPQLVKYTPSTTRDIIDSNSQEEIKKITADYDKQIKNAREDSSLIAKLLGERNTKISNIQADKDKTGTGITVAQEVIKATKKEEPSFTVKEQVDSLSVPPKWKTDSNITQLRKELKKELGNTQKEAVNTTLEVFQKLNISVPNQYLTFEQGQTDGPVTGFKGNGKRLNDQIGLLTNQSFNYQNDLYLYQKTNKKGSLISTVFSTADNKNIITSRISDYTGTNSIKQTKSNIFADRENFISIVPFSIVGLDDKYITASEDKLLDFRTQDKKIIGEAYFKALKTVANKKDPEFKLDTEANSMNTLQEKLLKLNTNSDDALITEVKTEMENLLGLNKPTPKNNGGSTIPGTITIIKKDGTVINNVEDTDANRNNAIQQGDTIQENKTKEIKEQGIQQQGGDGSIAENIYGVNKNIPTKKEPSELGDTTFKNLESVLKVLPKPMTGQEIKDNYKIDFPINLKSTFVPLK